MVDTNQNFHNIIIAKLLIFPMNSVMLNRLALSVSRLCKSFVFKFKAAEHRPQGIKNPLF